jgi:ABC-type uncharacterized transport system substrate-binding protein
VIVATGGATMTYMLQATHTVPIVFVIVPDPVGSGFVKSLSRPGGNATGFMQFEYSLTANPSTVFHREQIAALAARHGLPAVYSARDFVVSGGLASYSADFLDQYRQAAVMRLGRKTERIRAIRTKWPLF